MDQPEQSNLFATLKVMTSEQFQTSFERALTVGTPRREEIIREVRQHIDEAGSVDELGSPIQLAKQLNRVHLGWFSSIERLALASSVTIITLLLFRIVPGEIYAQNHQFVSPGIFEAVMVYRLLIIPITVGALVGRQVIRFNRPGRVFLQLVSVTYVVAVIMGLLGDAYTGSASVDVPDTLRGTLSSAFFTPFIAGLPMLIAAIVGSITSQWSNMATREKTRSFRKFQATLFTGLTILWTAWTVSMMSSGFYRVISLESLVGQLPLLILAAVALFISAKKIIIAWR